MFERYFGLSAHGTTFRREVVAGLTTFLTMVYIVVVNPATIAKSGLPFDAIFTATCIASAATTILMGLWARLPVALAPGMGINAFFALAVIPVLNYDWHLAFGCVFIAGLIFLLISITPAREWLINAIPKSLKLSIAAGIGFFLAFIGLYNAGIVATGRSLTPLSAGDLGTVPAILTAIGFVVIFMLAAWRVTGAVMIGILFVTLGAIAFGLQAPPDTLTAPVPSMAPTFMQLHFEGSGIGDTAIAATILAFLMVVMLDTSGTLTAVAYQGKLLDENGKLPNARRALTTDALGTVLGAVLGTSPLTAYIESSAGIQAGGRTGLTAVVVGLLFLVCLFFLPLVKAVPECATAPALLFVAVLMVKGLKDIDWDDLTEAAPALLTALAIPLTYSIATGIGIGFMSYLAIKIVSGRWRDLNFAVVIIALAFAAKVVLDTMNFQGRT